MKAKKLIATGIATSMLLLALTGCGAGGEESLLCEAAGGEYRRSSDLWPDPVGGGGLEGQAA